MSTVATNILPLIFPTITTPLNQNNKMEGHIFAPHRNKKYPFLCQMDPFLKLFPYVYLCCRCRIMHSQDTGYFYVLALPMMYSCTFPLCGTCVICPSARSWAGTSAVAPQECHFKLALFLRFFARSHFSWNVRKKFWIGFTLSKDTIAPWGAESGLVTTDIWL